MTRKICDDCKHYHRGICELCDKLGVASARTPESSCEDGYQPRTAEQLAMADTEPPPPPDEGGGS